MNHLNVFFSTRLLWFLFSFFVLSFLILYRNSIYEGQFQSVVAVLFPLFRLFFLVCRFIIVLILYGNIRYEGRFHSVFCCYSFAVVLLCCCCYVCLDYIPLTIPIGMLFIVSVVFLCSCFSRRSQLSFVIYCRLDFLSAIASFSLSQTSSFKPT